MSTSDPLDVQSFCEAFQATVAAGPDDVALRLAGSDHAFTWRQYADRVARIAAGLAAYGVGRGDAVGIMMRNRPEFQLVDTAALHLGATPFSVYNTSSAEQLAYLISDAGARVVVTEAEFVPRLLASGVSLDALVCLDARPDSTISLDDLETAGEPRFDLESSWRAVGLDDVATLIYTSGTTGPPKGVELTHRNLLAQLRMTTQLLPLQRGDRVASYLPSAHIADRWLGHYGALTHGIQITSVPDMTKLAASLPSIRPTVWGAVPRVWEKLKAGLEAAGVTDPSSLPDEKKAGVRALIGLDEARWSVSGAAPIAPEVLTFFGDLGLPICELFGMSELSCCATINPQHDIRVGTVGPALPGIELRLADDGELLVRGETVMKGYRNKPEQTAEALEDGWMHTGDIASIDDDGYVTIIDRKKELIINSAGKNMSPAGIEQVLKASSPLIGQAMAVGDRRPFNVALLVLDPDGCAAYAREHGLDDPSTETLAADPAVRSAVDAAVEAANERLSRVEQVKRFELLAVDWLPGGDELTPTSKLKRRPISAKYADLIEGMYAGAPDHD